MPLAANSLRAASRMRFWVASASRVVPISLEKGTRIGYRVRTNQMVNKSGGRTDREWHDARREDSARPAVGGPPGPLSVADDHPGRQQPPPTGPPLDRAGRPRTPLGTPLGH